MPGCQAATMLSWPFFLSIGNSVGPSHRVEEKTGMIFPAYVCGLLDRQKREEEEKDKAVEDKRDDGI